VYAAIFAAALLAQIHTGSDLLAACTAKDTAACDAFIRQTIKESKAAACFASVPANLARSDVVHQLRANEKEANGANAGSASELVAVLFSDECNSAE